jgi:uncharacterized protein
MDQPAYTFKQLAAEVLQDAPTPLTAEEIWAEAERRGLPTRLRSVGKTPTQTLYADLHRATQDDPESEFLRVGSRPRRYWLRTRSTATGIVEVPAPAPPEQPPPPPTPPLLERDMHPLLAWFADTRMGGVLVKTIFHEKSRRKTFGEWVHPDLVGVLFPRRALETDLALRLSAALSAPLCRLYSFELKLSLDFGNLREAFFQTVSNSSWAHEAFLVAASIDDSPEFSDELERLCDAFGVGVIELPPDDIISSKVRFAARSRPELDWSTVDKLVDMNADFASFLKNVTDDLKTDIHNKEYDLVPEDPSKFVDERRHSRVERPGENL